MGDNNLVRFSITNDECKKLKKYLVKVDGKNKLRVINGLIDISINLFDQININYEDFIKFNEFSSKKKIECQVNSICLDIFLQTIIEGDYMDILEYECASRTSLREAKQALPFR